MISPLNIFFNTLIKACVPEEIIEIREKLEQRTE